MRDRECAVRPTTALVTTISGFVIAERVCFQDTQKKWTPDDLPELPRRTHVHSLGESAKDIAFGAVLLAFQFTAVCEPGLIGWYEPAKTAGIPLSFIRHKRLKSGLCAAFLCRRFPIFVI